MNNNLSPNPHFKDILLERIRKGEIQMRPKAYFILKVLLLILTVLCILVTSSLLISFILFSINISGNSFLLGFGPRGIIGFLLHFPWKILIVEIILVILLEWLLKNFSFGYRNPFIYVLSIILLLSTLIGLLINFTPFHRVLLRRTEEKRLPVIGGFYEHIRRPSEKRDITRGVIIEIEGNILTIRADDRESPRDNGLRKVLIHPDMRVNNFFKIGDRIFIAGDWFDNKIHAYGIKKISPNREEN